MYGESLAEAGHCRMKYNIHFLTPVTEWFDSRDRVRMVPDGMKPVTPCKHMPERGAQDVLQKKMARFPPHEAGGGFPLRHPQRQEFRHSRCLVGDSDVSKHFTSSINKTSSSLC